MSLLRPGLFGPWEVFHNYFTDSNQQTLINLETLQERYPRPVVEYEVAKERFWRRYEDVKAVAAARVADEEIAKRASLSKGVNGAKSIAAKYGDRTESATQTDLTDF